MPADDAGAIREAVRMHVAAGSQEQSGRVDRPAREHNDVRGKLFAHAIHDSDDGFDFAAAWACLQSFDLGICAQSDVGMSNGVVHATSLGIGLGIEQAGEAIAGIAFDARADLGVFFVQHNAEGSVKRLEPKGRKVVGQMLDAWLVSDGRMRELAARRRLGGVFAAGPVDVIESLGFTVIWLQFVVVDRPLRRQAAVVPQFAEVFLSQSEQGRPVELGVAARKGQLESESRELGGKVSDQGSLAR